jgi:protease-4
VSLETDLLLDRRRLKRRLFFWRVAALLALLIAAGVGFGRAGGAGRSAYVARLTVSGIITDDRALIEAVDALAGKSAVRAVIVAIDSPGGSVAGGESLHAAIARVAAKKPVVAVMGATAASAGYMIAMPAERVFARDSTLTGSIGVILQTAEISGLLSTIGVTAEAITSGPLKDQPSLTRGLTDPGRAVLQAMVMDMYDQFVGMVARGRKMEPDRVRELADGRAYTGRQALKLGLVDEIGGEREARAWLAEVKQVPASLPVEDVERRSLTERALDGSLGSIMKTVLSQGLKLDGVLALWQPSLMGR